ncbi:uncharacterized protein [Porites lutea]|uniref:uncharacterized protein n=1 Tax=Porites lutea TaxID=51062 RepID=UPI003CC675DB
MFVNNPQKKLVVSSITTSQVSTISECTLECLKHQECVSLNFGKKNGTKYTCELINTDMFQQPDKLSVSQDFDHYNIKTPCMSNPCRNGGTCHPIYETEDYNCVCPFSNLSGKNCQNLICNAESLDICQKAMSSWTVTSAGLQNAELSNCDASKILPGYELLFIVTRGSLDDYGKYEIMRITDVDGCNVVLEVPFTQQMGENVHLIAQVLPNYDTVTLTNNCIFKCREQADGHGGILALRANTMTIDSSSKIWTTGQGFRGGQGGDYRGGGGYGGESFFYLDTGINGKGGDIPGQAWTLNTNGNGGGGAVGGSHAYGGLGGYNAGGGGADNNENGDDGSGGGGGGGHFSGGGGGGGANSCGNDGGVGGTASTTVGVYAGGGGVSDCTGARGGHGGQQGYLANGPCGGSISGRAGTQSRGGEGGDSSCGSGWGGAGGGGGMQFGNPDFTKRLSYGGGGGGGGGNALSDDPYPGGDGGDGGGLVYLLLDALTLDGRIESEGVKAACRSTKSYRSAPGGSGAGGSVVIVTQSIVGNPNGKILVTGGSPTKCAWGVGGGGGGGIGRWVVKTKDSLLTSG